MCRLQTLREASDAAWTSSSESEVIERSPLRSPFWGLAGPAFPILPRALMFISHPISVLQYKMHGGR